MEPELGFTSAWPASKHSTLAAAAAGGTGAVGVGVAQDGGGGAVQVGVHVQVARAQVALDQQLVLLRVAPAHHQVAAPRSCCCLSVANNIVREALSLSHSHVQRSQSTARGPGYNDTHVRSGQLGAWRTFRW